MRFKLIYDRPPRPTTVFSARFVCLTKEKDGARDPGDGLHRQPGGQPSSWRPNNSIWQGWLVVSYNQMYINQNEISGKAPRKEKK